MWQPCVDGLPDSDSTVMIYTPDSNEPIWLGYHDGEQWWTIEQFPVTGVTHWMDMPEPPQ